MATRGKESETVEVAERAGTDPWLIAAGASVVLSWYEFFLRGNRDMGLFIGLWPPTWLAFGSYFRQTRMSNMLNRTFGRSSVMESVERMIQNR